MIHNWWMIGFGVLLMIVEVLFGAITGLEAFILGIAFVAAGGVFLVTSSTLYSLVTLAVVFVGYEAFLKKTVQKPLLILLQRLGIDCVVGKIGVAVTEIAVRKNGTVFFDGQVWNAKTHESTIAEGTKIMVTELGIHSLTVVRYLTPNQEV